MSWNIQKPGDYINGPLTVAGSATITGDLGVGTASPSTKLEVATATANTRLRINSTSVVATEYFRSGTGLWLVGSDSTNAFKIARGSNFGGSADYFSIGSATADCTWFDAAGGTRMTLNSTGLGVGIVPSSFGRFSVQGTAGGAGILGMNTDATQCDIQSYNKPLALNRAGNNITMCEGGGNLGIGVTPVSGQKLTVLTNIGVSANTAAAADDRLIFTENMASANLGSQIVWKAPSGFAYASIGITNGAAGNNGSLIFSTTSSIFGSNNVERMRIDNAGNPIFQPSATPATLGTNGMLTVNATSNTNLRFSYRGSDGTTRVANITLA